MPNEFRVSGCRQESRLSIPRGSRNTHRMTGNVGQSRAACRLRITEFPGIAQRIHFVLQFLNLNGKLIHCRLAFPFLDAKVHLFSTFEPFQLLYSKTFSILPFLENFSYDLLEELVLFPPILCSASLSLAGDGPATVSPG